MKKKLMTQAEFARYRGVSEPLISKWVKAGVLTITKEGKINPEKAQEELANYLDPRYLKKPAPEEGGAADLNYGELRKLNLRIKNEADQLALDKLRGEVIPKDIVEGVWSLIFTRVRARLLAIPTKATPRLTGVESKAEIHTILKDHIYEALKELSKFDLRDYLKAE